MSYLVLARKWRPKSFAEMVGQEHVLRALVNALDSGRLHHAFLFTGTRGVGKTTLARILAKSLNCETGVSSRPCGSCAACREIDEGRFVDLIEVDAASRTKVVAKRGVTPIDRKGEPFDPNLENAVMQGSAEDGEPGTVCEVFQKGYQMGGCVLRHAMVKVVPQE